MMIRTTKHIIGLVLAGAFVACQAARAAEDQESAGTGAGVRFAR